MNVHENSGVEATITQFEQRLALTQRALRSFAGALQTTIDAFEPKRKTTLVISVDTNEPGADEPTHALTVVLHVYGYTATVAADGAQRVSATSSIPALAERLGAIDGIALDEGREGALARLHERDGGASLDAPAFLALTIDAVDRSVRERSAAYNPALGETER